VIISTIVEGFAWSTFTITGLLFIVAGNLVVLTRPVTKTAKDEQLGCLSKQKKLSTLNAQS
jgi:hypothetical protein